MYQTAAAPLNSKIDAHRHHIKLMRSAISLLTRQQQWQQAFYYPATACNQALR
jgi:hypothetical protein